jgi:protocadherin Fat 1/2/3
VQVHAIDLDSGDNGEVRYELKKGHGELFKVCRKTGEISLKQNLEGHNREYQLTIAAYDGGRHYYSNLLKYIPLLTL